MPEFDAGRLADLKRLDEKLADPQTPDRDRKKIENAIYAIKNQAQYSSIRKLREQMTRAVKNGDRELAERMAAESKRIDRDYQ